MTASFDTAELQIRERRKQVDFDVREFTIEFLVLKFNKGDIYIPEYQRDFVWSSNRQSKFIESIILGIPIPFLFLADVSESEDDLKEGNLEIVDGSQRIRTVASFMNNEFSLSNLDTLTELNGKYFSDFPSSRRNRFLNTSLKMIVISENSDPEVRFLMFERINTGSELLTNMEQRKGTYQGKFTHFIYNFCAKNPCFIELTSFTQQVKKRGEAEELILRFFAYSENYQNFNGVAYSFLNDYLENKNKSNFDEQELKSKFLTMLEFVRAYFPYGFLRYKDSKKTPRVRFEAISVGVILALIERPDLKNPNMSWLESPEFIKEISGSSTGTPARVKSRIEFVKNKLLGNI